MARNPWVQKSRMSDAEINAEIERFKNSGGEIINIPDNFDTIKPKSESAVKLGKVYRQLSKIKSKASQ